MKKIISIAALALVLVLALTTFAPALAVSDSRTVTVNLSLRKNAVFALYGVDVYIDGEKVCHLNQGEMKTVKATVSGSSHYIEFRGSESGYSYNFIAGYLNDLNNGDTVNIGIQTHEYWIEITGSTKNNAAYYISTTQNDSAQLTADLISWLVLY